MNPKKPIVCVLGGVSSGKTFLLNWLLQERTLLSSIQPTTAVITILRHIDDKPTAWPANENVFVLKKNADLRSISDNSIIAGYPIAELNNLTTYPQAKNHEAVMVFLDKGILKDCVFLDCPGGSVIQDGDVVNQDGKVGWVPTQNEHIYFSETRMRAIQNADACLLLSSVWEPTGCFTDITTKQVLFYMASSNGNFQTSIPHKNILFIGTFANPHSEATYDSDALVDTLRINLCMQIRSLPEAQRKKFDEMALFKRVILFYALDLHQVNFEIAAIETNIKKYIKNASDVEIHDEAKKCFSKIRPNKERVNEFSKVILTMIKQLQSAISTNYVNKPPDKPIAIADKQPKSSMRPTTLVVSYTAHDEVLWLALRPRLESGLKAHRNPAMKQLKIWTFRDLRGGQNDHIAIQQQFASPTSAGLLCVSVAACGRDYIQQYEWPLFRDKFGNLLKPFVAIMLSPIDFTQVDLGVLDRVKQSAVQLLHLYQDGKIYSWADCLNHERRFNGDTSFSSQFVDKLVRDLEVQLFPAAA